MIADLKPYPAMRDPDVPWLGRVPIHWERRRLKSLLRAVDRRSSTGAEPLLSLRRDHGIVVHSEHFSRPAQGQTTVGYKIVNKGQLVVNRLQANNGLVFDSSLDGLVSPDYSVFEPRAQVLMPYLSLLLRTPQYRDHFRRESTGLGTGSAGFLRLYDDSLLGTPVALPPTAEQAAILRFLDHADRQIRRYIRAKKKLLELLEEQKASVTDAVLTSGTTAGSGSGRRLRLKEVAEIQTGITLGKNYGSTPLVERPYLRVANVQAGRLDLSKIATVRVTEPEARRSTVLPGDVLMTEGGDRDKLGRGCLWGGEVPDCLHQNHVFAVRPKSATLLPEFLVAVMGSRVGREYFEKTAKQTTNLAATNSTTVGNLPLVLPTVDCQRELLKRLDAHLAVTEATERRAEREILLLRELRTRLIADIVTGKLDVREAAACLPDDVAKADEGAGEVFSDEAAEVEGDEGALEEAEV